MHNLIIILLFISSCNAQLVKKDKQFHLIAGTLISSIAYPIAYNETKNKTKATIYAFATSIAIGAIKESIDTQRPSNKFDINDLAYTALGGAVISITFNILDKKKQ